MPFAAPMPAELAAERWRLRILSDAGWRLEWRMSRDPHVVRGTLYPPDLTEEAARERIQWTLQRAGEQRIARYAVVATDGISIGTAGIACTTKTQPKPRCFTRSCQTDAIAEQRQQQAAP
jgi:hypothetical protein